MALVVGQAVENMEYGTSAIITGIAAINIAIGSDGPVMSAATLVSENNAPPILRPTNMATSPKKLISFLSIFSDCISSIILLLNELNADLYHAF